MRAFIPAIALCAVLHATAAIQPTEQVAPAAASKPVPGLLHAQLVAPSANGMIVAQRAEHAAPAKASLQQAAPATQPASGVEHRPTTAVMLLAAVFLMTGIALRRWGAGDQ